MSDGHDCVLILRGLAERRDAEGCKCCAQTVRAGIVQIERILGGPRVTDEEYESSRMPLDPLGPPGGR